MKNSTVVLCNCTPITSIMQNISKHAHTSTTVEIPTVELKGISTNPEMAPIWFRRHDHKIFLR